MAKKVQIGVLGAGRIGRLHITNLVQSVPEAEVVAIADPFLNEDAVAFAQGLGITKYSKDLQDILKIRRLRRFGSAPLPMHTRK